MGKLTGRVGELLKAEDFSGKIASTSIKRNVLHHQRLQISKWRGKLLFLLCSNNYQQPVFIYWPYSCWGGGSGQKCTPTSFSSVTSANVGISRKNIPSFSFNPLASQIIELEPRPLLKKAFFLVKSRL